MKPYYLSFNFLLFATACSFTPKEKGQTTIVETGDKPNIIIIYADDVGLGDIGVYGFPAY
jgi:hypothetical protein